MFKVLKVKDTIRVPPKYFRDNLEEAILALTREEYEGVMDEDLGIIVTVMGAKNLGEGKVVMGDGAAYFEAELELLAFKPRLNEVIEGKVTELMEFGTFVGLGPMEGLIHVSQLMDEYINYDSKTPQFIGKDSKRAIKSEDNVLTRIVTISMKGAISDSKIGMTMRQPYLGKPDWIEAELEKSKKKGKIEMIKEKAEKPAKKK